MVMPLRYRSILNSTSYSIQHQTKFSSKQLKDVYYKNNSVLKSNVQKIEGDFSIKASVIIFFEPKSKILTAAFRVDDDHNNCIGAKYNFCVKTAGFISSFITNIHYERFQNIEICSKVDLFDPEKKYIVDDQLVLEMNGILFLESRKTLHRSTEPEQSLTHILWGRNDKDVILSVGKENQVKTEIKVHKCVLGSRSTVFDAMINSIMKEKAESKVEITEFDPKIVETVIAFCYDQNISEFLQIEANLCDLFQFANKYDMQVLMTFLEPYFTDTVTPKNVCKLTATAFMSNSQKLQKFCRRILSIFLKQKISIENIQSLDKNFVAELSK